MEARGVGLLCVCLAFSGFGCLLQPDCGEDTVRGVQHGEVLETTLERVAEGEAPGRLGMMPACGRALGDVGGSFRWRVRLDGPGDGCANIVKVEPLAPTSAIVPSGATLPSGCTGTWSFQVLPRADGSILDPIPAGAAPGWVMAREFAETSAPGSCGLAATARSCADVFVAPTTRVQ